MARFITETGRIVNVNNDDYRQGGRAKVYQDLDNPAMACKIFNARYADEDRKSKLAAEIKHGMPAKLSVVWPQDLLYSEDGEWVGYTLPYVEGTRLDEISRDERFTLSFRLYLSYEMASIVVKMHNHGMVIGDLALENFLYSHKDQRVYLIDPDSFQLVEENGTVHYVKESRLKSSEMQKYGLGSAVLSPKSDDELLAQIIFKLLFAKSPFYEFDPTRHPSEIEFENARNGRFAYLYSVGEVPLEFAGRDLASLFIRAFCKQGALPSSEEFRLALKESLSTGLTVCPVCGCQHLAQQPCPLCGSAAGVKKSAMSKVGTAVATVAVAAIMCGAL